ncbi:MAG: hypothetical protein IIU37_10060 [Erysipelotrichaceae bacterium]|nr:hypothetical protein [Erysipelotrichaceae bacterium]
MSNKKTLSKLNRTELLDLLYEQEKRLEDLEKENKELKTQLENRKIAISKVGSIAEASLALTKVFDEAQKAVDRYLDNVQGIVREKQTAKYVFPAKQVSVQQVPVQTKPVQQQPAVKQAAPQQAQPKAPVAQKPVVQQKPAVQQPVQQKPVVQQSVAQRPVQQTVQTKPAGQPVPQRPAVQQPVRPQAPVTEMPVQGRRVKGAVKPAEPAKAETPVKPERLTRSSRTAAYVSKHSVGMGEGKQ